MPTATSSITATGSFLVLPVVASTTMILGFAWVTTALVRVAHICTSKWRIGPPYSNEEALDITPRSIASPCFGWFART